MDYKREGNKGQLEKAYQMLQSRKISTIKTLLDEESGDFFVKAMVRKSYGHMARPAVILFRKGFPIKAHCNCPVGPSGICCHVLAVLLFLKHFHETGEKLVQLTCTQQLQKWHRRTNRGSIPMGPLKDIHVKSAKRRSKDSLKVTAADPEKSKSKRDVSSIIANLNRKLDLLPPVTEHVYTVLSKSQVGQKSSVGQHLSHLFKLNQLGDHSYISKNDFEKNVMGIDKEKLERINRYINNEAVDVVKEVDSTNNTTTDDIILQEELPIVLIKKHNVYDPLSDNYKQTENDINIQLQDKNVQNIKTRKDVIATTIL